jgi:multisubunit Na+/H+ antiporter MnhG subunit
VTTTNVISDVLLVAGLVIMVCSCAGMAVFDDPLDRLHLVTPAAMLGSAGICASIVVRYGLSASGLAALGVAAILIAANPLTGHAVGRAIAIRRGEVWSDPADAAAAPSGSESAVPSGDEQ